MVIRFMPKQPSLFKSRAAPRLYGDVSGLSEHDIQNSILAYLARCSKVAWAHRMNSGKFKKSNGDGSFRWIQAGFVGCPDIMGQLTDGRFLAVEVKAAKGRLSPEQSAFLDAVLAGNGVAIVARSVDDVINHLT